MYAFIYMFNTYAQFIHDCYVQGVYTKYDT